MKYRHELKFKISSMDANILKRTLSLVLSKDKNAYYKDGSYDIKSLYFDDIDSSAYYEKIDGVLYRSKFRIRIYNDDESFIRLEKKMKHNDMTCKKGVLISKEIYSKIINDRIDLIDSDNEVLNEFIGYIRDKHLLPSVIVEYNRTSFIYDISEVRITFDSNIRSSRYNFDLFDKNIPMYNVLDDNKVVLEVKFNEVLPMHIAKLLCSIPACREAVSKFALCRGIK